MSFTLLIVLMLSFCLTALSQVKSTGDTASTPAGISLGSDRIKGFKIYGGMGFGYPPTFGGYVTYVSKINIGASFNVKYTNLKSVNFPSDYSKGTGLSTSYVFIKPMDEVLSFSLLFVAELETGNPKVRLGAEAGVSFLRYIEVNYQAQEVSQNFFGRSGNYTDYDVYYYCPGFRWRAKFQFPLDSKTGFELAISGNINYYRSYFGVEAYWIFGKVRGSKFRVAE